MIIELISSGDGTMVTVKVGSLGGQHNSYQFRAHTVEAVFIRDLRVENSSGVRDLRAGYWSVECPYCGLKMSQTHYDNVHVPCPEQKGDKNA